MGKIFSKRYAKQIVILIIVLASILPRFWNLSSTPPINVDEAANLRDIQKIIITGRFNPLDFHWDYSKTQLMYYPVYKLITQGVKDLLALRVVSVLLSIASLIPFYFIAKTYSNKLVAFCTTMAFSYSYYFLQFSRVGWINVIAVIAFGFYSFWLIHIGLQKKSVPVFILAGVLCGISFYFYRSNVVYIATCVIFLVVEMSKSKRKKFKVGPFFAFTVPLILTALPWFVKAYNNPEKYNLRRNVVNINNAYMTNNKTNNKQKVNILISQAKVSTKSWIFLSAMELDGSENPRYLPSNYPPVNIVIKTLFLLGIVVGLQHFRSTYWWYFAYFSGLYLGQIKTVNPPNGARGLIMLPFIYLFSALAAYKLYQYINDKKVACFIFTSVTLIVLILDFAFYMFWMSWIKV